MSALETKMLRVSKTLVYYNRSIVKTTVLFAAIFREIKVGLIRQGKYDLGQVVSISTY